VLFFHFENKDILVSFQIELDYENTNKKTMLLLLHVRCCHKCHISEMHLSFVPVLTMHELIYTSPPLPPNYTTYIAKITEMMSSKWLLKSGSLRPKIASLACVVRHTPCRCGPEARSANRAASSCQKVSSAFLLCLQLHIPIFFLQDKSGNLVCWKRYLTKPNSF